MAEIQESGLNALEMDAVLDAKSVYECIRSSDTKSTTDRLMLIFALKLKELLTLRVVHRLLWVDTRDMLAGALNKGSIARDAIRFACANGTWRIACEFQSHAEAGT